MNMNKIGNAILIIILFILVAWLLPWGFSFISSKKSTVPFVLYSTVNDDFILTHMIDSKRSLTDTKGNTFTQHEVDSLLPFFFGRQLMKDERFPDTIKGVPVTYRDSQHDSFFWRTNPRDINAPQIGVYQLMESASQRVQLETPPDVFRINGKGIEFIDIETNSLNKEKSDSYTDMMKKKGFVFPAKYINGNPSVKKDYDEGYLILDNNNSLYHVKQVVGRPYVRKIDVPQDATLTNVFITENKNKSSIGYAIDTEGRFYVIGLPGYEFKQVEIPAFDPNNMAMMIYANPFDWTFKVSGKDFVKYYAVDASDFSLLGEYEEQFDPSFSENLSDFINSIGLRFTSPLDKFVYPRFGI